MSETTRQTEFDKPITGMILKKSNLISQAQECYEIMLDDPSKYPNQFCVEFGVLKQMIVDL
jgi:hypothetical protein